MPEVEGRGEETLRNARTRQRARSSAMESPMVSPAGTRSRFQTQGYSGGIEGMTHARTRGTTRNLNESIDNDSIASICSEALMFAMTAPIPKPTRPARRNPAANGPISTKNATDWTAGIIAVVPNITRVVLVWRVITAPRAKPDTTIRVSDLFPPLRVGERVGRTRREAQGVERYLQTEEPQLSHELEWFTEPSHAPSQLRSLNPGIVQSTVSQSETSSLPRAPALFA